MFAIFVSAEYVGPCSLLAGEFPNPVREKSALVGPRDVPKSHNPLLQTAARGVPARSIARNVIVPGANDTDPAAVAAPSIAGSSPLSSTLSAAPFSSTAPFWGGSRGRDV